MLIECFGEIDTWAIATSIFQCRQSSTKLYITATMQVLPVAMGAQSSCIYM